MQTSVLPDTEFKTLVIKMFSEIRGRIDELSENFNKERNHEKKETEMKNTITNEEHIIGIKQQIR